MAAEGQAPTASEYIVHHLQHLQKDFAFQSVKQKSIVDFSVFNLDSVVFAASNHYRCHIYLSIH